MSVVYAQVPGFYAEVERAANPGLADRPVLVGGDPRKRGLVQSATPDAVALGVVAGMPVLDALGLCPSARALRTDMRRYREAATRLRACLRRVAERVEPVGFDAAYLEGPESEAVEALARQLQAVVSEELRLPLRVGIAPARFLALLAAEEAGPGGVRRVRPGEVAAFLGPLPVSRLPGVGPNTEERLATLGAHTVGELAALDPRRVEDELGNHGLAILDYARGRGEARVRAAAAARSLSQEATLEADALDVAHLAERLGELAGGLERALALEGLAARRLTLKLRYGDAPETATRSRTGARALETAQEIGAAASDLLRETQAGERPVRLVGISLTQLVRSIRDDRQLDLFSESS